MATKKEAVDFSKPTKWELQTQADDAKQAEAKATAQKQFSPTELTKQAKSIHEADVPLLGYLKYGELTLNDSFIIAKCKTDADKSSMAAYLMLKKAYPEMPTYGPENVSEWAQSMPLAEGAMLLQFLKGTPGFLRVQSLRGSVPMKKRSK